MKKTLPEYTIGRAGYDLFSSRKDLTVIMIPFERFSSFPKAVDDLYRSIDIPFNLIVVEGNAPESVRRALEKRQQRHKNITILYSSRNTSIAGAFNLALPHLKTRYAFLMDNDMRIPRNAMSRLVRFARENEFGIVCPRNYAVPLEIRMRPPKSTYTRKFIQHLGLRTCFLMSQEALAKLGKFDESMTSFTAAIDITMTAEDMNIPVCAEVPTCMEYEAEHPIWPIDTELYSFRWNEEKIHNSVECLEKKWGIRLPEQACERWLETKKKGLADSKNILFVLGWLISKLKMPQEPEKEVQPGAENVAFSKAA